MGNEEEEKIKEKVEQLRQKDKLDELFMDYHRDKDELFRRLSIMETELNTFRNIVATFNSIKKLLYGLLSAVLLALATSLANKYLGVGV